MVFEPVDACFFTTHPAPLRLTRIVLVLTEAYP